MNLAMTNKAVNHSPEPWRVERTCDGNLAIFARRSTHENPFAVALLGETQRSSEEILANAERIAACVNAMKGVANPEAFVSAVKEVIGRLRARACELRNNAKRSGSAWSDIQEDIGAADAVLNTPQDDDAKETNWKMKSFA